MRELIKNYEKLIIEVAKIIGYTDIDTAIVPLLDTKWAMTEDNKYFNFDRGGTMYDMWEYGRFEVSSLAMKQETLFMGEEDGLFFIMGYEEDDDWDDAEIYIFDIKNRIDWNPEDDW